METLLFDTGAVESTARTDAVIEAVESTARTDAVIEAVESAFEACERGNAIMPAKSSIDLPRYNGDFRAMPAYLDAGAWDAAGLILIHLTVSR